MLAGALGPGPVGADENLWGYVYGTETLPKGGTEIYQWITNRRDKGQGTYSAWDYKTELEYGFTDRFQGSVYLNFRQHDIQGSAPIEENGEPEYPDRNSFGFDGIQASLKYAFLSPYKDWMGLALYFEPGYSRINKESGQSQTQYSFETKLLLQKNFLDDQLVFAYNLTAELARTKPGNGGSWEGELEMEQTAGLSYRLAPGWFAGLEARYVSEYPDLGSREFWAFFAGPNLHWADKHWWATFTWLPQLHGSPNDPTRSSRLFLDDLEKQEFRLKVGYEF
jgi:hypothetical protein